MNSCFVVDTFEIEVYFQFLLSIIYLIANLLGYRSISVKVFWNLSPPIVLSIYVAASVSTFNCRFSCCFVVDAFEIQVYLQFLISITSLIVALLRWTSISNKEFCNFFPLIILFVYIAASVSNLNCPLNCCFALHIFEV